MQISILDLGFNNITSVLRSFSTPGNNSEIVTNGEDLKPSKLIILPGLGTYQSGVHALQDRKFAPVITEQVKEGAALVGICLGMQLLGDFSEESIGHRGLGFIGGRCEKLVSTPKEKVPRIGWEGTRIQNESNPFPSLNSGKDFYFVHSYHFVPDNNEHILSRTVFGDEVYVSSIMSNRILGLQFHPEKSGTIGQQLVSEIISWAKNEN
jgi:glutamine amidotransferase